MNASLRSRGLARSAPLLARQHHLEAVEVGHARAQLALLDLFRPVRRVPLALDVLRLPQGRQLPAGARGREGEPLRPGAGARRCASLAALVPPAPTASPLAPPAAPPAPPSWQATRFEAAIEAVRKEAAFALVNVTTSPWPQHTLRLVSQGVVAPLCELLQRGADRSAGIRLRHDHAHAPAGVFRPCGLSGMSHTRESGQGLGGLCDVAGCRSRCPSRRPVVRR